MGTFTVTLSELLEEGFSLGLTEQDYPIFDEVYREALNKKITTHYYNYEIGQETDSMFRFALNRKMNEIMPYYNQLYLSQALAIDPLKTINITAVAHLVDSVSGTVTTAVTADGTTTTHSESKARAVNSETPQVLLSPNEDYASSATNSVSDGDVTGNSENSSNENTNRSDDRTSDSTNTTSGYSGVSQSELLQQYRATFLNIDMMIINELRELFMQVWDNGDEYSQSEGFLNVYPSIFPVF